MKNLQVGVLGGLGPAATVDFMARVIAVTDAETDQDHIHLLVDQNPAVPDRQAALRGQGADPEPALVRMAQRLERAGCDFLVMPCNTAQAFAAGIRKATRIPLVSIVDVSIESLPTGTRCAGLLATPGCYAAGLYAQGFEAAGQAYVEPTAREADALMKIIYRIKAGSRDSELADAIASLIRSLEQRGADAVILGCTELSVLIERLDVGVALISSTDALARRTVALARGARPLPVCT